MSSTSRTRRRVAPSSGGMTRRPGSGRGHEWRYTQPSYSPDGRYLAAVKTNTVGTNVVILDARTGAELLRVTTDGRSWGPSWSPDGSQLAFLVLAQSGLTVDVHLANLTRSANGAPALDGDTKALTKSSGLDGDSRPAWWGRPRPRRPVALRRRAWRPGTPPPRRCPRSLLPRSRRLRVPSTAP